MARALTSVVDPHDITVVVNVGDDDVIHGAHVAADLDTVAYTLAGMEGEAGWGRADDTWTVMDEMARIGVDTSFRLGDLDLANCMRRTAALRAGIPLSTITAGWCAANGVETSVVPASDDPVPTYVRIADGSWLAFQEYFVTRRHRDTVVAVEYRGADRATPAPGVLEAIVDAELVVIAPSNPPLSIWPILAIPGIRDAVAAHERVVAVSPLFSGRAVKGPAVEVMQAVGLDGGNAGIAEAYEGLITDLVIDTGDEADCADLEASGLHVHTMDTRIGDKDAAPRFGNELLRSLGHRPG